MALDSGEWERGSSNVGPLLRGKVKRPNKRGWVVDSTHGQDLLASSNGGQGMVRCQSAGGQALPAGRSCRPGGGEVEDQEILDIGGCTETALDVEFVGDLHKAQSADGLWGLRLGAYY